MLVQVNRLRFPAILSSVFGIPNGSATQNVVCGLIVLALADFFLLWGWRGNAYRAFWGRAARNPSLPPTMAEQLMRIGISAVLAAWALGTVITGLGGHGTG